MKKKLYLMYLIFSIILFFIEFVLYLKFNSTTYGLLYMILSLIFLLILSLSVINYSEFNLKIRLSKNIILIFLLIIIVLLTLFKYNDESTLFIKNIKLLVYGFKPIEILLLVGLSIYDYKIKGTII